ncbi:MAG: hypothetical protein KJ674_06250 [Nanoarchaeota archaeon]|nr:hypothetical protein [Nanoarchaeota archaeon]
MNSILQYLKDNVTVDQRVVVVMRAMPKAMMMTPEGPMEQLNLLGGEFQGVLDGEPAAFAISDTTGDGKMIRWVVLVSEVVQVGIVSNISIAKPKLTL